MSLITLYRGVRNNIEPSDIMTKGTAGGQPPDQNAAPPTAAETKDQKGTAGECALIEKNQVIIIPEFVEYTSDFGKAASLGNRAAV